MSRDPRETAGPRAAQIYNPHNVVEQADRGFLIADTTNQRVRRVAPDGTISTYAGIGVGRAASEATEDRPLAAQFEHPQGCRRQRPQGMCSLPTSRTTGSAFVGTLVAPTNTASPCSRDRPPRRRRRSRSTAGEWSGTGPTFAYQWRRCDAGGGIVSMCGVRRRRRLCWGAADVGSTLRVVVTGSNSAGWLRRHFEFATVEVSSLPSSGFADVCGVGWRLMMVMRGVAVLRRVVGIRLMARRRRKWGWVVLHGRAAGGVRGVQGVYGLVAF